MDLISIVIVTELAYIVFEVISCQDLIWIIRGSFNLINLLAEIPLDQVRQDVPLCLQSNFHDGSSNLDIVSQLVLEHDWSFYLDKSTKLRLVIFYNDIPFRVLLNEGMASAHTNVRNSEIVVMASTNFDRLSLV